MIIMIDLPNWMMQCIAYLIISILVFVSLHLFLMLVNRWEEYRVNNRK